MRPSSLWLGGGGLLAVDKIDAATQGSEIVRQDLPSEAVALFKARQFGPASAGSLDERRACIAEEVTRTWLDHLSAPLLTLTAPTGSGKTLAIMNGALAVRKAIQRADGYAPRIIYCLPFTSVIDQNHGVFRAVLKANGLGEREDVLLKHHHLVQGLYRTEDTEYQSDGAGQLLTETWQSEIVVTTFHQLLHTLLSNANASLKRAGQLTGSIVLMDEVQALPLCYWEGLRCLFQSAARALGTRFVLLTATRPLIFRPEDAYELLPSHPGHFKALSRVRLLCHQHTPVTLDTFADRLIESLALDPRSMLIILNRRRAVRSVFTQLQDAFPNQRLIALSTDLTPRDRRARIHLIQRLLRNGKSCIVVSTQLVEAGVDVSFPVVHRDLAPLDSIIQSAGRCNRHDIGDAAGEVHLWDIHGQNKHGKLGEPLWQRIYDSPLIEVTTEVLRNQDQWAESDFLMLSQRYFESCWRRQEQARMDEWLATGNFIKLQQEFKIIPAGPPTTSLFIVSRPYDAELWQRYVEIHSNDDLPSLQKDQQFRKIRHAFFERVIQIYPPPYTDPENPILRIEAGEESYTRETGFVAPPQEQSACVF
jgi:CRISPR-associated endonuclease/helicase Cas3